MLRHLPAKLLIRLAALCPVLLLALPPAWSQQRLYLMNDNHTDYGWNDSVANYDAAMLAELDYYLSRMAATESAPDDERTRYTCDGWFWVWLYRHHRSPAQFADLIRRIQSGRITIPLNPMVTLYGALQTEAAIRSGYWPGRLQRQYGVPVRLAQYIENQTSPWGLASLWAGSGIEFTWKGICGCATAGTYVQRDTEVFRWQGPDGRSLLMKWYFLDGSASWGGYAEARGNLTPSALQRSISHFSSRAPFIPLTGLFGGGWDDVGWQTTQFESAAQQWNASHVGGDRVRVSNGIDYFEDLATYAGQLPVRRGGWGNEWDMGPAALAERTAQTRRGIESLHAAEGFAAIVHRFDPDFWPSQQAALEAAFVDFHKYYEHSWSVTGSASLSALVANKKLWADNFEDAVLDLKTAAAARFAALFETPNTEDRFAVFNPLAFERTDLADLPVANDGPFIVTDLATAAEVPNQVVVIGGSRFLRILASAVPSFGYRVYQVRNGTGTAFAAAASVSGNTIENTRYRVTIDQRGRLSSVIDKSFLPNVELAGAAGFNDFGSGTSGGLTVENAGPVSVTLRRDVNGTPPRRVRVTLTRGSDRVDIENEILANYAPLAQYTFQANLTQPQIRFEEVGAIMRPGFSPAGDYLPGARTDHVTLNHFVSLSSSSGSPYTITLSNLDAFLMRIGNSTVNTFDLPSSTVRIVASAGTPFANGGWYGSEIYNQGGDAYVLNRFALHGSASAFSGAAALRTSLAHQNPLEAVALGRNQSGPLRELTRSFLTLSADNVVATAVKPAEEGERGWIVRLWEAEGRATSLSIDASGFAPTSAMAATLIESDTMATSVSDGRIAAHIGASELKSYRFAGPSSASPSPSPSPTASATASPRPSAHPSPTPIGAFAATISGSVGYFSGEGPVPGVVVRAMGASSSQALSDGQGAYHLQVLAPQAWRLEPVKSGDLGSGISAGDASCILRAVVGLSTLNDVERLASDVSGNGTLSAIDASYLLQYRVGLLPRLPAATLCDSDWLFVPTPAPYQNQSIVLPTLGSACTMGAITYQPLVGSTDRQDFVAALIGDCQGNWKPSGNGAGYSETPRLRWAERAVTRGLRVPLALTHELASGGLEFEIEYDPAALIYRGLGRLKGARGSLLAVNARQPGKIRAALASPRPLPRGTLLVALFDRPTSGGVSQLRVRVTPGSNGGSPSDNPRATSGRPRWLSSEP